MNYLFFDIECANCFDGNGKICEFSYVLTDGEFNVLKEESMKMNPCAEFDKKGFAMANIHLEEDYDYYYKQPDFAHFYPEIRRVLQMGNVRVVGHETKSDAQYLIGECKRYNLQSINFVFYDTKKLAKLIYKRDKNMSLSSLYQDFCKPEGDIIKHQSLADARMTMEVAKFYAQDQKIPFYQVLTKYSLSEGEAYKGRVLESGRSPFGYTDSMQMAKKAQKIVEEFVKFEMTYESEKTYVLPLEFEKNNFKGLIVILNRMKEKGVLYLSRLDRGLTDRLVYVANDGENRKLEKYQANQRKNELDETVNTISFSDFLQMLDLTEEDLSISDEELDDLIGSFSYNKKWYDSYKKTHTVLYRVNDTLKEDEFECGLDFPVIQYRAKLLIEKDGEQTEKEGFTFYDYVLDAFFQLHPYRVNRGAYSYLPNKAYKKTADQGRGLSTVEIGRNFTLGKGERIKDFQLYQEYPYITSYKFKGKFNGTSIQFEFSDQILVDDDFKNSIKSLAGLKIDVEKAIKEFYDEKLFETAIKSMAKFKFGYKDKNFEEVKIVNKKYLEGDEILLPKEYYLRKQAGTLDESYLPSLISFTTELFKGKIQLPVLIRRKNG